jgi:opacity protein-like surface antigen
MRRPTISSSLATTLPCALALAFGILGPASKAQAGDFGAPGPTYGNIGGYGSTTPVPAPIPVPVYEPEWYFRADFAAGFGSQPALTTTGTPFGGGTVGLSPSWLSEDFLPSFTGGVGVGYVWTSAFRTDFTVDIHSIMDANFVGSQNYGAGTVTVDDKTRFMSTILLWNGYYDIRTGTAFSPYIGGGLGFAVNQLTRSDALTDSAAGSFSVSDRTTRVNFAGAAMAGVTYDVNSMFSIDVGYRFLYIGGTDIDLTLNGLASDVQVGGISEHQVRAGFRFYVD